MKINNLLRPTFAGICLNNVKHNIKALKNLLSKNTEILPIVKADAYGHGMLPLVKTLIREGINKFGVATLDEAVLLRENYKNIDILLLGSIYPYKNLETVYKYDIVPTISSLDTLSWFNNFLIKKNTRHKVHLKIDTGMHRIGFNYENIKEKIEIFQKMKNLIYDGIYSHFASSDSDEEYTELQLDNFNKAIKQFALSKILFKYKHIANSASILKNKKSHFNLVRPGLLIYGLLPFEDAGKKINVKPVMNVKSKIVFLKWVKKNSKISYGGKFVAPEDLFIATIPLGYADGYPRALSNLGYVLIKGKKCFITGRICMDMIMVNVTGLKNNISVGEEVTLMGDSMTAEKIAYLCNTINYEITCNISKRVPRIYEY